LTKRVLLLSLVLVVVSCSVLVYFLYAFRALVAERLIVRDATERVNLEIGPDPIYKSRLTSYLYGNGDKTLLIQSTDSVTETGPSLLAV